MAMGDHCEVQLCKVDSLGRDVVREDLRIIAGIEQDALAAVFKVCRKPPVFLHGGGLAEGIVEDRDLRRVCLRARRWRTHRPGTHYSQSAKEQITRQCR